MTSLLVRGKDKKYAPASNTMKVFSEKNTLIHILLIFHLKLVQINNKEDPISRKTTKRKRKKKQSINLPAKNLEFKSEIVISDKILIYLLRI